MVLVPDLFLHLLFVVLDVDLLVLTFDELVELFLTFVQPVYLQLEVDESDDVGEDLDVLAHVGLQGLLWISSFTRNDLKFSKFCQSADKLSSFLEELEIIHFLGSNNDIGSHIVSNVQLGSKRSELLKNGLQEGNLLFSSFERRARGRVRSNAD